MRDLANKMAELKFEAPLAQFEETDEWGPVDFQTGNNISLKAAISDSLNLNLKENDNQSILLLEEAIKDTNCMGGTNIDGVVLNGVGGVGNNVGGGVGIKKGSPNRNTSAIVGGKENHVDNFTEAFTGSLEDLVNTFDEKITKCFGNYEQSVEELAPVQVRSQEEIMNECQ